MAIGSARNAVSITVHFTKDLQAKTETPTRGTEPGGRTDTRAERKLGREVQATIRDSGWLTVGAGPFHESVTSRPLLKLPLPDP